MIEAMANSSFHPRADDIAIVGYSFKLPQDVNDDQSFWEVLENRRNLRTDWPASRANPASFASNKLKRVRALASLYRGVAMPDPCRSRQAISSMRTWALLTRRFSQSRRTRRRRWIQCSDGPWRNPTALLRKASESQREDRRLTMT